MTKNTKDLKFVLPLNDPKAMREFERATQAVRFEIMPEPASSAVLSALYNAAIKRCAGPTAQAVSESYLRFCTDVAQINAGRTERVLGPGIDEFRRRVKRALKTLRRTPSDAPSFCDSDFRVFERAPWLEEIDFDGSHLRSILDAAGVWRPLSESERAEFLAQTPWMTIVIDNRTRLIHSFRFHPPPIGSFERHVP